MKKEQKKDENKLIEGKLHKLANKGPCTSAKKFYCKNGLFKRCGEQA